MLVTPQLSAEIDKLLPKAQAELVQLMESAPTITASLPNEQEITEIMLSIGDIDLLVKKTTKDMR